MRNVFAVILILLLISPIAHAQISSNFGGANGGAVIIGESSTTCDGSIEGAIRYESISKKIEYCDGLGWADWWGG
jgi:hypothetical protein